MGELHFVYVPPRALKTPSPGTSAKTACRSARQEEVAKTWTKATGGTMHVQI